MVRVVYFNQWFTSIVPVMQDIKKKYGASIHIVASSKNPEHAYKSVVDRFILEDDDESENAPLKYCKWLNKTLKDNCADIAFIYRHQDWVSKYKEVVLKDIDTGLVLDTNALHIFSNKQNMYKCMSGDFTLKSFVPRYWDLTNVDQLLEVEQRLIEKDDGLCMKLNSDVGGESFRKIETTHNRGIDRLLKPQSNRMEHKAAISLLRESSVDDLSKIMFMEYLHGPEISVDCYRSKQGFIAINRVKTKGRTERIYRDAYIKDICSVIADKAKLKYPFNVQFRLDGENKLKITDINLRMSGGSYLELAGGLNICELCILDILNWEDKYNIDDYLYFKERTVTHYETAIEV